METESIAKKKGGPRGTKPTFSTRSNRLDCYNSDREKGKTGRIGRTREKLSGGHPIHFEEWSYEEAPKIEGKGNVGTRWWE